MVQSTEMKGDILNMACRLELRSYVVRQWHERVLLAFDNMIPLWQYVHEISASDIYAYWS